MAAQDVYMLELAKKLDALAKQFLEARSIVAIDEAGRELTPPLTRPQIEAAAASYTEAATQMRTSCQQLVLGIRITS